MQERLRLYEGEGLIRRIDHAAIEREARELRALHIGALIGRALSWIAHADPRHRLRLRQPLGRSARLRPS